MNFYIPELKDAIKLTSDWSFDLYAETRNESVGKVLGLISENPKLWYRPWKIYEDKEHCYEVLFVERVTIPKDTILVVDRIYVRNGQKDYSSVTFRIKSCPDKKFNKTRFWAKLHDTRSIEFEVNT